MDVVYWTFAKPLSAATSTPADENPSVFILKVDKMEIYMMCVNTQETRVNILTTIGGPEQIELNSGPVQAERRRKIKEIRTPKSSSRGTFLSVVTFHAPPSLSGCSLRKDPCAEHHNAKNSSSTSALWCVDFHFVSSPYTFFRMFFFFFWMCLFLLAVLLTSPFKGEVDFFALDHQIWG